MTRLSDLAVTSEDRVRLLLVQMVMGRIRCHLITDGTGLTTCETHQASTEDWRQRGDPLALVCLRAVTEAGLMGGH